MTATRRRVAPFVLVMVLAACGSTVSPSSSARTSHPGPSLTPVPGGASATPAASRPGTTRTDFGRIWDALPAGFPKLPAATTVEPDGPASGAFAVNGDASTLATSMRRALTVAGWTADTGSPLEDGTVVLEATGAAKGCKAEVRFTPRSGTVVATVLVAAACPFE